MLTGISQMETNPRVTICWKQDKEHLLHGQCHNFFEKEIIFDKRQENIMSLLMHII